MPGQIYGLGIRLALGATLVLFLLSILFSLARRNNQIPCLKLEIHPIFPCIAKCPNANAVYGHCPDSDYSCLCSHFDLREDELGKTQTQFCYERCAWELGVFEQLYSTPSRKSSSLCYELSGQQSGGVGNRPIIGLFRSTSFHNREYSTLLEARIPQATSGIISVTVFITSTILSQVAATTYTIPAQTSQYACEAVGGVSCAVSLGGGCCPEGYACASNGCVNNACGVNSYLCATEFGGGCCENGLLCATGFCYVTSPPLTTVQSTTITPSSTPSATPNTNNKPSTVAIGVVTPLAIIVVGLILWMLYRYRKRWLASKSKSLEDPVELVHEMKDTFGFHPEADSNIVYELGQRAQVPEMKDTFGFHPEADSNAVYELNCDRVTQSHPESSKQCPGFSV